MSDKRCNSPRRRSTRPAPTAQYHHTPIRLPEDIVTPVRFSSLSPARRRLINLLLRIGFGRVERLLVRRGEPIFDPPPNAYRTVKFGLVQELRSEAFEDYDLKESVLDLLGQLTLLSDGCVERIEISNGNPLLVEVQEPVQP